MYHASGALSACWVTIFKIRSFAAAVLPCRGGPVPGVFLQARSLVRGYGAAPPGNSRRRSTSSVKLDGFRRDRSFRNRRGRWFWRKRRGSPAEALRKLDIADSRGCWGRRASSYFELPQPSGLVLSPRVLGRRCAKPCIS